MLRKAEGGRERRQGIAGDDAMAGHLYYITSDSSKYYKMPHITLPTNTAEPYDEK